MPVAAVARGSCHPLPAQNVGTFSCREREGLRGLHPCIHVLIRSGMYSYILNMKAHMYVHVHACVGENEKLPEKYK